MTLTSRMNDSYAWRKSRRAPLLNQKVAPSRLVAEGREVPAQSNACAIAGWIGVLEEEEEEEEVVVEEEVVAGSARVEVRVVRSVVESAASSGAANCRR